MDGHYLLPLCCLAGFMPVITRFNRVIQNQKAIFLVMGSAYLDHPVMPDDDG